MTFLGLILCAAIVYRAVKSHREKKRIEKADNTELNAVPVETRLVPTDMDETTVVCELLTIRMNRYLDKKYGENLQSWGWNSSDYRVTHEVSAIVVLTTGEIREETMEVRMRLGMYNKSVKTIDGVTRDENAYKVLSVDCEWDTESKLKGTSTKDAKVSETKSQSEKSETEKTVTEIVEEWFNENEEYICSHLKDKIIIEAEKMPKDDNVVAKIQDILQDMKRTSGLKEDGSFVIHPEDAVA